MLISEQQVTETLGEIRLRRQDIHRKLLDTSMYAAVLRFVCYGRDMSELSIVIESVAGNKAKHGDGPSSMFAADDVEMNQDGFSGSPSSGDGGGGGGGGGGDQVPFIAASRRNTVIGRYRHGAQSKKLAGGNKNSTKKQTGKPYTPSYSFINKHIECILLNFILSLIQLFSSLEDCQLL